MCKLCSDDVFEKDRYKDFAEDLRKVAAYYDGLAHGVVKPHDVDRTLDIRPSIMFVIRNLVQEWI